MADEIFMAWHIARYVQTVAAAGRAEYPLPMYVNAWLAMDTTRPGQYPSGGPVHHMLNVWQAAAPDIAMLAPDIYADPFTEICQQYATNGNPLFIPESKRDEQAAANVFYAIGEHHAIGFAPFGIESMCDEHAAMLGRSYELLDSLRPLLRDFWGTSRLIGVRQTEDAFQQRDLGGFRLEIAFAPRQPGRSLGAGLIFALTDDHYLIAGHGLAVRFLSHAGDRRCVDFLSLEEGLYRNGQWLPGRRLNGDEYAVRLNQPALLQVKLYQYDRGHRESKTQRACII